MEIKRKNRTKYQNGITLIGLVVTIIVLLILAGVSIATLTGDNGLLSKASETKIMTVLGALKEEIELERTANLIENKNMTVEQLLADGKVKRTVQAEDENYYMYYAIKPEAYEGMQGLGKGTLANLKDVFLIDDEFHIKYIDKSGKEYGDNINKKILEDETEIRFASKAFSEYVSRISGVTETEMKFKWMKNQTSLTISDANVTTVEDLVFFPNLQSLTITGDTNLENLVGAGNCTKLTSITFNNVNVNSIKGIEECVNLKAFSIIQWMGNVYNLEGIDKCSELQSITILRPCADISSFIKDIKNLSNLTSLEIQNNSISSSDISNLNRNLTSLKLESCKINNISGISNLSNLKALILNTNSISDINDISSLTKLARLELGTNKITDISTISNLTNLTELDLSGNQISDISTISSLTELKTLNLSNNQITSILPLSSNTKLTTLNLKNNTAFEGDRAKYTGEDLIKLNKIGEILDRGGTISVDTDKLGLFTNYKTLDLSGQNLENIYFLEGLTELTSLSLSSNPALQINDEKSKNILNSMKKLKSISLVWDSMDISALNTMTWLTNINLWGANIDLSDIEDIISNVNIIATVEVFSTISNCNPSKISKIDITTWNKFHTSADLSKFVNLTELSIPKIYYDSYSFIENMVKLTKLNLSYSNTMHGNMPNFSKLSNLTSLNISNCYLSTEDLENLKALKNNRNLTIDLTNNSIINASALLELDTSCKIYLGGNVNLTQESKNALKARFGSNVSF